MEQVLMREELETLYMCRNKAREVARMEKRINAPFGGGGYRSPSFSGMPGARDIHGLDGSARRNEADFQALERAYEDLHELQRAAQKIICALDPKMHDFCMAYFIAAGDMDSVADSIGRDRTTCWRKLQKLRGGDGNGSFRRRMNGRCNKMQQNAI